MKTVFLLLAGFLTMSLALWNGCLGSRVRPQTEGSVTRPHGSPEARLGQAGPSNPERDALRGLVQAVYHPDRRPPAFSDIRSDLEGLYERAEWQPLWLKDARPTVAARQLIARRATDDRSEIGPTGYDARRLDRGAPALARRGRRPAPTGVTRYDLRPTVAAVRRVSNLQGDRLGHRVVTPGLPPARTSSPVGVTVDSLRVAGDRGTMPERGRPVIEH